MERFRHLLPPLGTWADSADPIVDPASGGELLLPRCLYGDPVSTRAGFGRIFRILWQTGSWARALRDEVLVPLGSLPGPIIMHCINCPGKRMIAWHLHWIQTCLAADWRWEKEWLTAEVIAGQRSLVLAGMGYWWFAVATMSNPSWAPRTAALVPAFETYDDSDLVFFRRVVEWQLSYCLLVDALRSRLMWLWGSWLNTFGDVWPHFYAHPWHTFLRLLFRTLEPKGGYTLDEQYHQILYAYHKDVLAWLRAEILNGSTPYAATALTDRPRASEDAGRDSLVEEVFWAKGGWPLWSEHLPLALKAKEGFSSPLAKRLVAFRTGDHRAVARAIESLLPDRAAYVAPPGGRLGHGGRLRPGSR